MALSLLAVSCKKDGTPTPTNPITIDAATLDEAIKKKGTYSYSEGGIPILNIDFSKFDSKDKKDLTASIGGTINNDNVNNFKSGLEKFLSFSSDGFTATATAEMPNNFNSQDPVTVTVVIDAGNNTFADDVKTAYTVKDKKATVVITIKPEETRKWDGNTVG